MCHRPGFTGGGQMITINLLPVRKSYWKLFFWISVGFLIVVLVFEIGLICETARLERKNALMERQGLAGLEIEGDQELLMVQQDLLQSQDWEMVVQDLKVELVTVEQRIELLRKSNLPAALLPFLYMLPEGLPEVVWLTMIQEKGDEGIRIQGEGVDQGAIVTWIDYLKLCPGVGQVHLQSLQGVGWFKFALEVEWGEDG